MHLVDLAAGFMGSTPIVGGTVPLAVGAAWAASLRRDDRVTVVFFGDGCFEEGVVHESLNFAALHRLPIVFVCENNRYSVYTRLQERQPRRAIHALAAAHGVVAQAGDGNDVEAVAGLARQAVEEARRRSGPQFIELSAYRWREHCGPNFDDELGYRSEQEIAAGLADCPVARYQAELSRRDAAFGQLAASLEVEIAQEIEDAFGFALASPRPTAGDAGASLYA